MHDGADFTGPRGNDARGEEADTPWWSDDGHGPSPGRATLWWLLAAAAVPWIVAGALVLRLAR